MWERECGYTTPPCPQPPGCHCLSSVLRGPPPAHLGRQAGPPRLPSGRRRTPSRCGALPAGGEVGAVLGHADGAGRRAPVLARCRRAARVAGPPGRGLRAFVAGAQARGKSCIAYAARVPVLARGVDALPVSLGSRGTSLLDKRHLSIAVLLWRAGRDP